MGKGAGEESGIWKEETAGRKMINVHPLLLSLKHSFEAAFLKEKKRNHHTDLIIYTCIIFPPPPPPITLELGGQ